MSEGNKFELDPGPDWPPLHVRIVEYDPDWPIRFERERELLVAVLGAAPHDVHHFGSTAVPGLAAKPTIDIAVAVRGALADVPLMALRECGYVHRRRTHRDDLLFLGKGAGHEVHLQLFEQGNPEIEKLSTLRDYLRENQVELRAYEILKRELAERHAGVARYYARDKFVALFEFNERARRWKDTSSS